MPSTHGIERGRSVAVVGNAASLLDRNAGWQIDSHDYVIRMNRGIPTWHQHPALGSKTTIIAGSYFAIEELKRADPRAIWLMSPKDRVQRVHDLQNGGIPTEKMFLFPDPDWDTLRFRLNGHRPSTGCMVVHFLVSCGVRPELYGFDFWRTKTWYDERQTVGPHHPMVEEEYLRSILR